MTRNLFARKKRSFVRTDGQDTIVVTLKLKPDGIVSKLMWATTQNRFGVGKSSSTYCALARPYKQLLEEGKPVGKINYVFFRIKKQPSHIVGTLCFTPGKRLMFYPGLLERRVNWIFSKHGFQDIRSTGLVDHISLEHDFQRWHLTVLEPDGTKKTHFPSSHTKALDSNVIFWFGLTLQSPNVLETTPEELTMVFPSPSKDSDRRVKLVIDAREKAVFHLTTLDDMSLDADEFLHFDFFIGPVNLSAKDIPCFVPMQEPIVAGYSQVLKEGTPFRSHPVSLEGIPEKIWVVVSKHRGKLSDKAIFTCV